ncbi:LacI family transcriptional regulator [Paenibacillus sp. Root52]|uniref:LacI family transcriptional regulator n=1 Tax=Paenibacillus amylolyticus TaxID=1451 RepID=A0AAP5LLT7_PAEAM|nr:MULTISPECIES: LacI family DNA-binding transcriptional regulator [Paenibacillus]KQY94366.1 LacI family transcriptional regulator [Paenibacillus sp. Root52]MDR6721653.1 LacI family transcriptional regulator [Paenibacillus amylolyticus]
MTKEKVTIQDIADALGISRNTASKALNDSGNIPEETKNRVVKKAIELKYKQFAYMENEHILSKTPGNIALLTENLPNTSHFGSLLISGLEKRISSEGYNLSIHIVREVDKDVHELPNNFDISKVDGIICIELFDIEYTRLITELGIPTIFIDCASNISYPDFQADLLLMENEHSTYKLTKNLIDSGYKNIGFAGDYNHCKSFNERWIGFNRAMLESDVQVNPSYCITDNDKLFFSKPNWLKEHVVALNSLPSAYVCANDFIAVEIIRALRSKGLAIPQDVVVYGFDNAPESRIIDPPFSTVHIYSNEMGIKAAEMLLSRIDNPAQPYQISHIVTKPILR